MIIILPLVLAGLAGARCFEPRTAHPPPDYSPRDPLLQRAFDEINDALTALVEAPEFAAYSYSVEVTSQLETIWSTHHTARERNASRPDIPEVNGDAIYRIASITKAFTTLGILHQHVAGNLSLDETVNTYIEELGEKSKKGIPWKDITIRSLASQLSGLPRECTKGMQPGFSIPDCSITEDPSKLGLPPVSREGLPKCDEYSHNYDKPCNAADLLSIVETKLPLFAPNQKSTYSNLGFDILGFVLSRVSNQTYEECIDTGIFKPLNMTRSTFATPSDSAGVIPFEPHYWDVDEGIQKPTGGIYASSADLSKFLRYVLTHFNGITHAINWLNPVSPSRGLNSFYGMPWEILQTDRILKGSRRTVQFNTKGGGLPGYFSIIVTIPEYSLGVTILIAGPAPTLMHKILEIVTVGTVRAAEQLSINQMNQRYAGTYQSSDPTLNSTMTLEANHRGLLITKFISNSTDLSASSNVGSGFDTNWYAQLTPTLLYRDEAQSQGEQWRMVTVEERQENAPIWDDFCVEDIDRPLYAGLPVNEVVFWNQDEDTRAFDTLELTAFRVNLTRVEREKGEGEQGGFEEGERAEL